MNRKEFAEYWNNKTAGLGNPDSLLWEAEHNLDTKCEYFQKFEIEKNKLNLWDTYNPHAKSDFWEWCGDNLEGLTRCFSSDGDYEWWGFTNKKDIVLFSLRWS